MGNHRRTVLGRACRNLSAATQRQRADRERFNSARRMQEGGEGGEGEEEQGAVSRQSTQRVSLTDELLRKTAATILAETVTGQEKSIRWIYYNRIQDAGGAEGLNGSTAYRYQQLWYRVWSVAQGATEFRSDTLPVGNHGFGDARTIGEYVDGHPWFREVAMPRARQVAQLVREMFEHPERNPYDNWIGQGNLSDFNRNEPYWRSARAYFWLQQSGEVQDTLVRETGEGATRQFIFDAESIRDYFQQNPMSERVPPCRRVRGGAVRPINALSQAMRQTGGGVSAATDTTVQLTEAQRAKIDEFGWPAGAELACFSQAYQAGLSAARMEHPDAELCDVYDALGIAKGYREENKYRDASDIDVDPSAAQNILAHIKHYIDSKYPVVAGVNVQGHTGAKNWGEITDHFVTLTGYETAAGKMARLFGLDNATNPPTRIEFSIDQQTGRIYKEASPIIEDYTDQAYQLDQIRRWKGVQAPGASSAGTNMIRKRARGGNVARNHPPIPALLEPGERVFSPSEYARNKPLIESANRRIPRFGTPDVGFAADLPSSEMGGKVVPGTGAGDIFTATLEPGSFVLNRNAAAALDMAGLETLERKLGGLADRRDMAHMNERMGKLVARTRGKSPKVKHLRVGGDGTCRMM